MSTKPYSADDIRALWQTMPTTPVAITADEMHRKAKAFQSRIRVRNFIEYGACAFVIAGFTGFTFRADITWLMRAANMMIVAGTLLAAWNLHRRGRAVAPPSLSSTVSLIDFHRAELLRQRNAMRTMWRWYLLPFLPGLMLWFAAVWLHTSSFTSERADRVMLGLLITFLLFIIVALGGTLMQLLGAASLQRRIEDLSRYTDMDQLSDLGRMGDFGKKKDRAK